MYRKREESHLKLNYLGIVGGILAFISIGGSWWTMTMKMTTLTGEVSSSADLFLYEARKAGLPVALPIELGWFSWAALALLIIGGIIGIVSSLGIVGSVTKKFGKKLPVFGGVFALLSMIIFAVGLQMQLSSVPGLGLFSDGNLVGWSYSTGLSIGFWLALIATIVTFAALRKMPEE